MQKLRKYFLTGLAVTLSIAGFAQNKTAKGFSITEKKEKKQVELYYDGRLLTSYCYYDSVMKPVLYPIKSVSGVTVTRGYPLDPQPGERVDHPHHIGLWLNHESVNGLDFWNNSTSISYSRRARYGTIRHEKLNKSKASGKSAMLETEARWCRKDNTPLLRETTRYEFEVSGNDFIIDRITTLQAIGETVLFKDIKDGFLGIRVARELELPANDNVKVVSNDGTVSEERSNDHSVATGTYLSSEGMTDNDVWGTRAKWVTLSGKKDEKNISLTIIDHSRNPGYPSYFHARGYGLFAINPLGDEVFSKGNEKRNLTLKKGESVTFRYRVVVHEGETTAAHLEALSKNFTDKIK